MAKNKPLLLALGLALVHLVLAYAYAAETPFRTSGILLHQRAPTGGPAHIPDIGAPDELQHVNYVVHLRSGQGIPVLHPGAPDTGEHYEDHQPPLYYCLATAWIAPFASTPDLSSPGDGQWLRRLNGIIGGSTVLGAFFLGLWGFRRPEVGIGAAIFVALLPMNVALDSAVSNDPLLFALSTWVIAICAKAIRDGWCWRLAIWTGLLTGLALLNKTNAIALVPAVCLAMLVRQESRPTWKMVLGATALALVFALPWWIRNTEVYGDPFAIKAFKEAFTGSPMTADFIEARGAVYFWRDMVGWWLARSFIGTFGYMDIFLSNWLYAVYLVLLLIPAIGWVLSLKTEESKQAKGVQLLNAAFFGVVLLLFIQFNRQYFQAQARYLIPAIGPIGVGIALGLTYLAKNASKFALAALAIALLGLNIYILTILPDEFLRRTGLG